MKKIFYIISFTFLGFLFGFLVEALIEIKFISLLLVDFEKYSLGFSMSQWFFIHKIWAFVTFFGGVLFGFFQGKYWWKVLYEKKSRDWAPRFLFTVFFYRFFKKVWFFCISRKSYFLWLRGLLSSIGSRISDVPMVFIN